MGRGFPLLAALPLAGCYSWRENRGASYYGRSYEEGRKIPFADALHALWYILKYEMPMSLNKCVRAIPKIAVLPATGESTEASPSEPVGA